MGAEAEGGILMDQSKIGAFIQERRKQQGLTQQQLADRLGVTNKAVSKWETGRSMPDVGLFEPLCRELAIGLPELLAGRAIEQGSRQAVTEQLLTESISIRKLVGLQVFLLVNSVIGVLLALSPLLFRPAQPLAALLVGLGLLECAMVIVFDAILPGKEERRQSFLPGAVHSFCLFLTLVVLQYPAARREEIPLARSLAICGLGWLLSLGLLASIRRLRRRKGL